MKDQYVGDVGDYVKLALLRHISPGHKLGVNWYLTPHDPTKKDGRFTGYLCQPEHWRDLDAEVFDHLKEIVGTNRRTVRELEILLPKGTRFWSDIVACPPGPDFKGRHSARSTWARGAVAEFDQYLCDLIFLDPDNGLQPMNCKVTHARATKHVLRSELGELKAQAALERDRTIVVYYHNTRRRGGQNAEVTWLCEELVAEGFRVLPLRARSYSPRTFLILDALPSVEAKAVEFAERWRQHGVTLG
jgi:hypothetical protein